jgi:hypothetical protein
MVSWCSEDGAKNCLACNITLSDAGLNRRTMMAGRKGDPMNRLATWILIFVSCVPVIDAGAVESSKSAPGKPKDLTFDDLKFDHKKGEPFVRSMLGEKIEKLEGTSVRIRGYMYPHFQQKGITEFVLVRDNMECCFGPGAALYDCVRVNMAEGKSVSYSIRPVAVQGKFEISEFKIDGTTYAIYHMVADEVK